METKKFVTLPHPLTNIEIQEYYQNEARFNGVYSSDSLPTTIKDGAYVINLDEYAYVGTHWMSLYNSNTKIIYFDILVLNMFLKKLENLLSIKT